MDDTPQPVSLRNMVIGSVDTLRETELPQRIPPTWHDTPPLIRGPRNTPETPQLLKGGIPPALRCAVWLSNVIQAVHPHQDEHYWHEYRTLAKVQALDNAYELLLSQIVSESTESETRREREERLRQIWLNTKAPTFCGRVDNNQSPIIIQGTTSDGALAQTRVLVALDRILSGGVACYYAPLIPSLVALLLTAQSEAYAFCTVREMSHQTSWYFSASPREYAAWCKAFGDVLCKLHPQTGEYLRDRGVLDDLNPIFVKFFIGYLPLEFVLRILDIYTLEGAKVLYRFGVALLVLFKRESAENLLTISNADEWWTYFKQWTHNHSRFNFDLVVRKAYGAHGRSGRGMMQRPLRFPRRQILQRIIRMEEERLIQEQVHDESSELYDDVPCQPLGLVAPTESSNGSPPPAQPVLAASREARQCLAEWMPLTLRLTNLDLLYSTSHHGRSLEMFYSRVKHAKHTVLLCEVLDTRTVVGMYASQAWRTSAQVYGDGACFLFRLQPNPACWKWKPRPLESSSAVARGNLLDNVDLDDSNNSTALLEQFMVSTNKYISLGGNPDGSAGLRFNDDFTKGESSPAVGYENEPLHGGHGSVFEVGLVEVYGLTRQIDGKAL